MKRNLYFLFFCLHFLPAIAQQLNDGPILLQVRQREWDVTLASPDDVNLNASFFSLGAISEDEYTFKLSGKASAVNTTWYGGTCFTDEFDPSIQNSMDFNDMFYNQVFPGTAVPQFFDLKIDCHEDDIATDFAQYFNWGGNPITPCANYASFPRCDYNASTCCANLFGCLYSEGDDVHCDAPTFKTNINYRLGNPCEWYNHGFVAGSGCTDNIYQPRIESFWRYTKGTACNDAINLGTLTSGPSLTHFNSNVCYSNNLPSSPGNDVFYSFTLTQPMGVRASLCGTAVFNTYLYLLDGSCNVIASNDDFCNLTSEVSKELCAAGTYYLVVDGATAADMGTFTLSVSEQPNLLLDVNAGPDKIVCLGQSQSIGGIPAAQFGTGGYVYQWSPAAGLSATNVANPNVTGLVAGSTPYILTVTDNSGCSISDTLIVLTSTPPTAGIATNTNLICSGSSATMTGTGGSGTPPYQWLFNNGTLAGANTSMYGGTLPGNYSVVAYNAQGCADTSSSVNVQVVSGAVANVAASGSTSVCQGDTVFLNGYGIGLTYQWLNNNAPIAGANASNYAATTPGNYGVIMSFGGQCADTSTTLAVSINPNPNPNISPNTNQTICQGQTKVLTASGGTTYQWYYNGVAVGGNTATYNATLPGNYYALVSVGACVGTTNIVNLTVNPTINALITTSGATTFCQGQSVTLVGTGNGAANQTLQWIQSPNTVVGNTNSFNVTTSGSYQFIINNNGCADTSTAVNVTVNNPPVVSISPNTTQAICAGASINLQALGGSGSASYVWYENGVAIAGANSANLIASNAGAYYATVTEPTGCFASTSPISVNITPVVPATISANGNTTFCQGQNVLLVGSGNGSTGQTIQWLLLPNTVVGNTNTLSVNTSGNYQFILSNNGCSDTSATTSVVVNTPPAIGISPSSPQTICAGANTTLQAVGAIAGASFQWLENGQPIAGATNPSYAATNAGAYSVNVTDANGCSATSASVSVTVTPVLPATISANGATTFCAGESVTLIGSGTGSAGQSYSWLNNGVLVGNTNSYIASQAGNYTFVLDNNACLSTSSPTLVTVNPLPTANLTPSGNMAICEGNTTPLLASGGFSYVWFYNGQIVPFAGGTNFTANQAGTYWVSVVDTNNCAAISPALALSYLPLPLANIAASGATVFCKGDSVSLLASGGDTYQWVRDSVTLLNATQPVLTVTQSGNYQVIVATSCGADSSANISVQESPLPTANFLTEPAELFVGLPFRFVDQSVNAATWAWNLGDSYTTTQQNPTYSYNNAGNYAVTLMITNDIGCRDTIRKIMTVKESQPFIPNTFTPNGDGIHDYFETNFNALQSLDFKIFDRWGKMVFFSQDPNQKWDGKTDGNDAAVGTYYYVLKGQDYLKKEVIAKGWVQLLR